MDRLLTLKETGTLLNVSKSTLQRWDKEGKLIAVRTEGGHRRYKLSDIEKILGKEQTVRDNNDIIVATYARCPTQDQNIDRQSSRIFEYCTKRNYKVEYIIKDIGSGLNDKRKGFIKLCNLVVNRKINKVVIEYKDRLTRFQYNLIEFFFKSYGVEIELLDKKDYTEQEELVNDMMMFIASFIGQFESTRKQKES